VNEFSVAKFFDPMVLLPLPSSCQLWWIKFQKF